MKRRISQEKVRKRVARKLRVGRTVSSSDRIRLTVYRSARHIYASLVDPESGRTITTVSTRTRGLVPDGGTGNVEAAKKVGSAIADAAKQRDIQEVVFHRNGFRYHGRVKALADAARESGLRF